MSRSRKKTLPQKLVNVATTGLPSSVRKYLGNRIVALLIVLTIPLALATGVVSVTWVNGRPRLSVDEQKAAEVKEEAAEKIQELRDDHHNDRPSIPDLLPHLTGQETGRSGFAADWQRDEGFGSKQEGLGGKIAERAEALKDRFREERDETWNLAPATVEQEAAARQAGGPLSRLKQRLENLR